MNLLKKRKFQTKCKFINVKQSHIMTWSTSPLLAHSTGWSQVSCTTYISVSHKADWSRSKGTPRTSFPEIKLVKVGESLWLPQWRVFLNLEEETVTSQNNLIHLCSNPTSSHCWLEKSSGNKLCLNNTASPQSHPLFGFPDFQINFWYDHCVTLIQTRNWYAAH